MQTSRSDDGVISDEDQAEISAEILKARDRFENVSLMLRTLYAELSGFPLTSDFQLLSLLSSKGYMREGWRYVTPEGETRTVSAREAALYDCALSILESSIKIMEILDDTARKTQSTLEAHGELPQDPENRTLN